MRAYSVRTFGTNKGIHAVMSANEGKSRISRKELSDIELNGRLRELGLWQEKLRRLKYDRDADIAQKAVVEDLTVYFMKLETVYIRERTRRESLTGLKSAWQELAAIEAKMSATAGEEKPVLEAKRTHCRDWVFSLQESAAKAARDGSELGPEIGGNAEYVAYLDRDLDRLGMKPENDLRPELLSAEDSAPAATEPPNTSLSTGADTHTAREKVADAVKKKLNNPSQHRGMLIEEVRYAINLGRSSIYRPIESGVLHKQKRRPGSAKNSRTLITISSVLEYMEQNDIDINAF
jgi:hypothetical protein